MTNRRKSLSKLGNLLSIRAIILIVFCIGIPTESRAQFLSVDGFKKIKRKQETENGCWAACIQMAFGAQGVPLAQNDLVVALGGDKPASSKEIAAIVDGLKGSGWHGDWRHVDGPPKSGHVITELENDRPIMVGYRTGDKEDQLHAVMVYAVILGDVKTPKGKAKIIKGFYVYDPTFGKSKLLQGKEFYDTIKQTFFFYVIKE